MLISHSHHELTCIMTMVLLTISVTLPDSALMSVTLTSSVKCPDLSSNHREALKATEKARTRRDCTWPRSNHTGMLRVGDISKCLKRSYHGMVQNSERGRDCRGRHIRYRTSRKRDFPSFPFPPLPSVLISPYFESNSKSDA